MKSRNLIFSVGVVSLLFILNLNVNGQTKKGTERQSPIRFKIISNEIVPSLGGTDVDRRDITVLIDEEGFSESNLVSFFNYLSHRFPKPRLLYAFVYTNRKDLGTKGEQPLMHLRGDDTELAGDLATFTRVKNSKEFSLTFKNGDSYLVKMEKGKER